MSRHNYETQERLTGAESRTIFMPDLSILDFPHIPILWGVFDPDLYRANRIKLLNLETQYELTQNQRNRLKILSDPRLASAEGFFQRFNEWSEVENNLIASLNTDANPDLSVDLHQDVFEAVLREQIRKEKGNVTLMGRSHSILFPTHVVLRHEMENPHNTRVAEIVFDEHIDTVKKSWSGLYYFRKCL